MPSSEPVTVRHLDDFPRARPGAFVPVRRGARRLILRHQRRALARAFRRPPRARRGDDAARRRSTSACPARPRCVADGAEHELRPGVFARVSPGVTRQIVTHEEPVEVLCLGGVPGGVYQA